MRRATILICSFLLPSCLTGLASAEPSVSEGPRTRFEQFRQEPTAQNALQLAKDGLADPSKLPVALMLTERHSRLFAWALYHYPIPTLRKDLEGDAQFAGPGRGLLGCQGVGPNQQTRPAFLLWPCSSPKKGPSSGRSTAADLMPDGGCTTFATSNFRVNLPDAWPSTPRRTCRISVWRMRHWRHLAESAGRKRRRS